ncbi:MAG: TolC family protein [Acidobacteria bacterium]|nr:TolC family protein [Acidobacteriota bacterium]
MRRTAPRGLVAMLALLTVGLESAFAQAPRTFTLEEIQRLALGNYQTVETAREAVEQARLARRQATSAVLPTVAVTGVTTRNLVTGAFEFGGRRIEVLPGFDYNIALAFSQPIFAGLRDIKTRRQADLGIDVAHRSLVSTAQDAALEATRGYYEVLSAQENVEISRRALTVTDETLRVAESLYRAGEAVETAVLRARVANSEARRELLQAENHLMLARQQLTLLTGTDEAFAVTRPPKAPVADRSLEALIEAGLERRAELQALERQRGIAALEIEKRRGQHLHIVRAEGTYLKRRSNFPSDQFASLAVNATWTLFDGGRTAAEVATARSQLRQLDERRELLRNQTAQQIRAAYLNVQTLAASVDMLTAQIEFARKNADSTARAYRVGEATDWDVLEATQTLTRSERQLSVTAYTLDVGRYELQRAVGEFAIDLVRSLTEQTTGGPE